MKKLILFTVSILLFAGICNTQIDFLNNAFAEEDSFTISIALSPETIVLGNKAAGFCGIHTNIGYWSVDTSTLELNGLAVDVAKSDSHGNLIVMVRLEKVKTVVSPPSTTLTLSGYTKQGVLFYGSDIVRVQ
jgi:hypothetical protein